MLAELPVLRLGLAGFSTEQKKTLGAALQAASPPGISWQVVRFVEADAWWVNGSKVQQRPDGTLRVGSGCPSEPALHLNPRESDRPLAFSLPLSSRDFEPSFTFDAVSVPSMRTVLEKFSTWLMPLASQFALAARILQDESMLGGGIYHVSQDGKLLAVVNLQGEIGISPAAVPADFEDAMWSKRPASADSIPEPFRRCNLSELMWHYAVRTGLDVLPKRYRTDTLYFRRSPRLPQRELKDSHLLLIRELAAAPRNFAALQKRTGLSAQQLAQDLAALYLVGSITSNPKRAAAARASGIETNPGSPTSIMPSVLDSDAPLREALQRPAIHDMTAPAPMSAR